MNNWSMVQLLASAGSGHLANLLQILREQEPTQSNDLTAALVLSKARNAIRIWRCSSFAPAMAELYDGLTPLEDWETMKETLQRDTALGIQGKSQELKDLAGR